MQQSQHPYLRSFLFFPSYTPSCPVSSISSSSPSSTSSSPASFPSLTLSLSRSLSLLPSPSLFLCFRLSSSLKILEGSPLNFDGLKGVGLSLFSMAIEEETRVFHQLLATAKGMVQLNYENFYNVVIQGDLFFFPYHFLCPSCLFLLLSSLILSLLVVQ